MKIANLPVNHGVDAEVVTNKDGGKQSFIPTAYHLMPPHALTLVSMVLAHGEKKYGPFNWHHLPSDDHLNHTLGHLMGVIAWDSQDDGILPGYPHHLRHAAKAATRALFLLETLYLEYLEHESATKIQ